MTVAPAAGATRSADAIIVDDTGAVVARRTLSDRNPRACLPLVRAVGAWASLVLDAELNRARDEVASDAAPQLATARVALTTSAQVGGAAARDRGVTEADPDAPPAKPPRAIEVGTMVYLRDGLATTGGMAGVSPFITLEFAESWVLRPALFFGRSTERITADGQRTTLGHFGVRGDICRRLPGNYVERRGIAADLCGGVDAGVISPGVGVDTTPARLGTGPSLDLRGELGAGLALEIRALVGANVLPFAGSATPLVYADAEVGLSMRLR